MLTPTIATAATTTTTTTTTPATEARPNADAILLVRMRETADLSQEAQLPRGAERRAAVWNDLVQTTQRTQEPVRALLDGLAKTGDVQSYRSIPIGNAVVVTVRNGAQQSVVDALRGVQQVGSVLANRGKFGTTPKGPIADSSTGASLLATIDPPKAEPAVRTLVPVTTEPTADPVAWGVAKIGAPAAWSKGYTGAGVTVGILDSGTDVTHEALRAKYRGTQADGSVQNDYNWLDTAGFSTGAFSATPSDSGGHGSHVAGTVLGSTPTHKTGVAPGARFIAAKMVFEDSILSTISALDGLQFMLAPTRTDGTKPDPSKGVDVINNSWGHGDWERLESQSSFDAIKAAGILVVNAAGNEGPNPGSVSAPGSYPGHISVAASTSRDTVTSFSSRGPSEFGGDAPNVTAPGAGIQSVRNGGGYTTMDGTSMAAPHVTGAIALMLEAKPQATYEQIKAALESTATDIAAAGVDPSSGSGRINVDRAIDALLSA